jgi:hypothetical protein
MKNPRLLLIFLTCLVLPFVAATAAFGDGVHSCKAESRKMRSGEEVSVTRCVIEVSGGHVGDVVEIKNPSNYIVASGKIVRTRGRYALVIVTEKSKEIRTGFPVTVRNNDSMDYWTATKAPY